MKSSLVEQEGLVPPALTYVARRLPDPWSGELRGLSAMDAEELRLRAGHPIGLRVGGRWQFGKTALTAGVLEALLIDFCEGALYAHRERLTEGYVTLRDGSRVGVCGRAAVEGGRITGICDIRSMCIRLPGELPSGAVSAAAEVFPLINRGEDGRAILICAPPGVGKTTLLRALALRCSRIPGGWQTVVVDSRCELTPLLARAGGSLDLLTGYPRGVGIEIALRTMGAELILCDEIGNRGDVDALLDAQACGVPIVATVHGSDPEQILRRPALAPLFAAGSVSAIVSLSRSPGGRAFDLEVTEPCL
ncbi:MAG: hypothetical protein IKL84_02835 [Clostridia bacterium]|nr:hypothetical protein [Clostridia bacterium]